MLYYPLKVTPNTILFSYSRELYIFQSASISSFVFLLFYQQLNKGARQGNAAKMIKIMGFEARLVWISFLMLLIYGNLNKSLSPYELQFPHL